MSDVATPTTLIGLVITLALGMAALLGWLLRHVFAVTLPQIQAQFREEMQKEREQCQRQFHELILELKGISAETESRFERMLAVIQANQEEYRRNQEQWRERWREKHGKDN